MTFYEKQLGIPMLLVGSYFVYKLPPWELFIQSNTFDNIINTFIILVIQASIFIGAFGLILIERKPKLALLLQGWSTLIIAGTFISGLIILVLISLFKVTRYFLQ